MWKSRYRTAYYDAVKRNFSRVRDGSEGRFPFKSDFLEEVFIEAAHRGYIDLLDVILIGDSMRQAYTDYIFGPEGCY